MSGKSRLIFMLRPDPATRRALVESFLGTGLHGRLGSRLVPFDHWHQPLAPPYPDNSREATDLFLRVGARVRAEAFTLVFDHLAGRTDTHAVQWALRCKRLAPELSTLIATLRRAFLDEGLDTHVSPRAHITISDDAPASLPVTAIRPVQWRVEQFALVRAGGEWPHLYETLHRWPLLQTRPCEGADSEPQLGLF